MQDELLVLAYIYGSHALRRPEGLTAGLHLIPHVS